MAKKTKFFSVHGECTDKFGDKHTVTLVGKLERIKETFLDSTEAKNVVISNFIDITKKKLSIGMAICHKWDEFNLEVGENLAKRRIKHGDIIGSIETKDPQMLTEDAVNMLMLVRLSQILKHIEEYIPKKEDQTPVQRFRRDDGKYDMSEANEMEIVELLGMIEADDTIILSGGREMKKTEVQDVLMAAITSLREAPEEEEFTEEAEPSQVTSDAVGDAPSPALTETPATE